MYCDHTVHCGADLIIQRSGHHGTKACSPTMNHLFPVFYRATACNATHGIAAGILSVRLSVCPSDACIVTKLNNALRIF